MTELSSKGIRLTNYYGQPSCTPSRVALMTGKFPYKNGFQNYEVQYQDSVGVPLSNKLMPQYLSELGYKTVGFGKWNIGHCNSRYLPSARGFEHFIGYTCPGHGYTTHNCGMGASLRDMFETWKDAEGEDRWATGYQYLGTYDTLLYRDKASEALINHAANHPHLPLFMWSAQHGIHSEWDSDPVPPKELLTEANLMYLKGLRASLKEEDTDEFSRFFKMRMITASVLMSIDNSLKSLVETLENLDMYSNTVIFVNSDNGGDTLYTKGHPGNNYPLRSEKFGYFEGGVRLPAFVVAPTLIPAGKVGTSHHGLMHHVDLLATFVNIAGGDSDAMLAADGTLDSLSHWDSLVGDSLSPRSELVLNLPRTKGWQLAETETTQGTALRMGNFKLLLNHPFDSWFNPLPNHKLNDAPNMLASVCKYMMFSVMEELACTYSSYLFDLSKDPNELDNLWALDEYKDVKKNMMARMEELVATQSDYGVIIPEYQMSRPVPIEDYFKGNNNYVVPWGCDTIA